MSNGYELELANRKMAEFQNQAAQDALVQELKEAKREQRRLSWYRLIGRSMFKLNKHSTRIAYRRQAASCNSEEE